MKRIYLAACLTLTMTTVARSDLWWAQPMTVHEWGVHEFDYAAAAPAVVDLPPFVYTDAKPGVPVPLVDKRAKDYPPDSGIRKKPILYFYPGQRMASSPVPLGAEIRFAEGHANAWYPQVNTYRTPAMTAGAKEPDWEAWRKANVGRVVTATQPGAPVPDDPRMELVWSRLNLTKDLPVGGRLREVPPDNWMQTARQVESAYVSNGTETEKFLFYEGATHETPSVAVVPEPFTMLGARHIVNVAPTPIYNVFAIYHHEKKTWVGYVSVLEPLKPIASASRGGAGDSIASLELPTFDDKLEWVNDADLPRLTTDRLLTALTEGGMLTVNHSYRDPADPQGPTTSGQLYADEARALEKIWHEDFFNSEGLTIVYRQSPAALDKAMPLNLYTDMYSYIALSRCGMTVCKHVPIERATDVFADVARFSSAPLPGQSFYGGNPNDRDAALPRLKKDRLLTMAAIAYYERLGASSKEFAELEAALNQK